MLITWSLLNGKIVQKKQLELDWLTGDDKYSH